MRQARRVTALEEALGEDRRVGTRAEITADFCTSTLHSALRRGTITRVGPGLYALARRASELETRVQAASMWAGDKAMIGGLAALASLGHAVPTHGPVLVVAPPSFKRTPIPGIRLLRSRAPVRAHVTDAGRFARTEDAMVQAWIETDPRNRAGLMLDLLRDLPYAHARLVRTAASWPKLADRAGLATLIELHEDGVRSYLEHVGRTEVFVGPEWARFDRQVTLRPSGRRFDIDMLARDVLLAVEFDGARFHSNDRQRRRDLERDALLATLGYTTVRLTYEDLTQRPEWCRRTVRAAVDARLALLRGPPGTA